MKIFQRIKAGLAGAALGFRSMFGNYSEAVGIGSTDRSANFLVWLDTDTRQYLDPWTRDIIARKVEWLFQNFGVVKEAVRGIARLTVGKGICLQLNTDDEEWNALAEQEFESWAMSPSRCDLAGRRNFYEIQSHAVAQRLKTGEFFAAFVKNPRWQDEPCLQLFDAREIATASQHEGNHSVVDGVELDATHCPVRYWVRGLDEKFRPVPASEMVHWYHADATNQVRGVSDFAQAVAPLADAKELIKIVTKTAKQNSAIGLHIKNLVKKGGQGALDTIRTLAQRTKVATGAAPGSDKTPPSNDADPAYERLVGGGAIIYTDESGDAKFLTPNSPSPLVEPFITKVLMRDGLNSAGVPSELFWDCANLNSANQRFVLIKGEATFVQLGDGCEGRICNPAAVRVLMERMASGKLRKPLRRVLTPKPEADEIGEPPKPAGFSDNDDDFTETWVEDTEGHWMGCLAWQRPAKLSIDNGRDAAAEISQLANGIETLSTINDRRGRGWRPMVRQWFREFSYAYRCAKQEGVGWAISLWRAGMPGAAQHQPDATQNDDRLTELEQTKDKPADKPAEK